MKYIFYPISLIFCMVFYSCTTNSQNADTADTTYLENIAQDKSYKNYRVLVFNSAKVISGGHVDIDSFYEAFRKSGHNSVCSVSDDIFLDVKGGKEHKDLMCQIEMATKNLKNKFPKYSKLSDEDRRILREMFELNNPNYSDLQFEFLNTPLKGN